MARYTHACIAIREVQTVPDVYGGPHYKFILSWRQKRDDLTYALTGENYATRGRAINTARRFAEQLGLSRFIPVVDE